jgi:hypothetical protein
MPPRQPARRSGNQRRQSTPIQHQSPVRGPLNAEIVSLQPEILVALNRPGLIRRTGHQQQWAGE